VAALPSSARSASRARPDWALTFRLRGGEDDEALLAARRAAGRPRRLIWLGLQAIASVLASLLLLDNGLAARSVLSWLIALLALSAVLALTVWRERDLRSASSDMVGALLYAAGWGVALALFTGVVTSPTSFMLVALCGSLLTASTVLLAATPAAGALFGLIVGGAATGAIATGHNFGLAAIALLFTGAITAALAINARALLRRIAVEQTLGEKEEVISLLLREFEDSGADWLWRTDSAKCLVEVTPRLARQFGKSAVAIEGKPLLAMLAGEDWESGDIAPAIRTLAERLRLRESFRDLTVPVTIAGEQRWWSLSATPRRDERGALIGFWGVGTDVTEHYRSVERIDRMARYDALTGLANRAHVIEALGQALLESHHAGRRSALMLIDLDRFKQINDTLGHPIGDKLLIEVARRLTSLVRPGDVCGRLGGDEFAVVIPDASNRDRTEGLAERIVAVLSAPYEIEDHRLHIGASVGSATSPRDGRVVETMLRNADLALYRAKDDGRGVLRRYEPQLHAHAEQRRRIEIALRDALERGEMRLVYQPIVDAAHGGVAAFEALLRWSHPELGTVSPEVFVPIAEEARLIGRIGDWVLHTACRDAASWPGDVRVAINMAPAQLRDPQLPAAIVSALSHSGLAAHRLELEIAEEVFVKDGEAAATMVDKVLALGVRIALDDFGTGRSSLGYLRKGRFSTVKIDRSFVRGATGNAAESIAIVRAVVAMAESLGMTTIAEGAETRTEYERMRGLGCRHIQGWQVGQPIDAATARALVAQDRDRRVA